MKKFIAISITICLLISFLPMNIVKSSTITDIKEIQTFAVPKGDFIGSATLYEMNFYEGEFNSKYIFPMQGMCFTSDGYIAVIDNSYGLIHVLTPLLQEKFSFGSLKDFTYPTDIAYATDTFYVSDPFRKAVYLYNKNGEFIKKITNNAFTSPIGVTVLSNFIFVSDYFSNTLFKLDSSGKIVGSIGINFPLGLSTDSKNYIFAVSGSEDNIYVFDSNLKLIKTFGSDVLTFPSDVSIDSKGYVYVVDRGISSTSSNNPKIAVFDNTFKFVNSFGKFSNSTSSIPDGSFLTPAGIAISQSNSVYVFDAGYYFNSEGSDAPFGYPEITRLSVFTSQGYFSSKKGFVRNSSTALLNPISVTLDENGNMWVLNRGNLISSEVVEFSGDGTYIKTISKINNATLPSLTSIYADKKGNLLLTGANQVIMLTTTGNLKKNVMNSNFGLIKKLILYNGYYWATSLDKNLVLKLDLNLNLANSYSVCSSPSGIAFDSKGNMFVTSLFDNFVHVYDKSIKEINKFGGSGKGNFKFYIPEDVDIDKDDIVYVANSENGKISVFTSAGVPLFETPPNYPGITSIDIEDSFLLAANAFHNVLELFQIQKQYTDYNFLVSVTPDVSNIGINDFINVYFTIQNTGIKQDSYSFTLNLTNSSAFSYSLSESITKFNLLPNQTKRIKVFVSSLGSAQNNDSTELIIKVTSNTGLTVSSNAIIKVSDKVEAGIFIDDVNSMLGTNSSVPVFVKNATGITGISFDLIFDKSKVAFIDFALEKPFENSVLLKSQTSSGMTILVEFPRGKAIFGSVKIGTLSFKTLNLGSSILNISEAKYAIPTGEISEFKNLYPGSVTVTPFLSINIPSDYVSQKQQVSISGKTTPGCAVTINGLSVKVDTSGNFSYNLTLSSRVTILVVSSKAPSQEETVITSTISYSGPLTIKIELWINNPIMQVNGIPEEIDPGRGTTPIILSGWNRTLVPIRAIVEKLGATVEWNDKDKIVTIRMESKLIKLQIGNNIAEVNGKKVPIDDTNPLVKPIIMNDRTMVPLRFVAEQIGCTVNWDSGTRKITIEYYLK